MSDLGISNNTTTQTQVLKEIRNETTPINKYQQNKD